MKELSTLIRSNHRYCQLCIRTMRGEPTTLVEDNGYLYHACGKCASEILFPDNYEDRVTYANVLANLAPALR